MLEEKHRQVCNRVVASGAWAVKTGYVYIMASISRTLYTGVTSNLERCVWEHSTHAFEGFSAKYHITKLVYIAEFSRMGDAIAWEKAIKGKSRAKKIALIEEANPKWNDLAWNWFDLAEVGEPT
jgi:putative endonuclease